MVLDITVLDIAGAFFSVLLAPRIKINSQLSALVLHGAWSSENHLMVLSRKAAEESGKRPCEEREWAGSDQGEEEGPMVGLHSEETGA